jgi:hypothetical protein
VLPHTDLLKLLAKAHEGWDYVVAAPPSNLDFSLSAALNEGVATLAPSRATVGGASLKPTGEIDLLRQAFDLRPNARGKAALPNLSIAGPWMTPKFTDAEPQENSAVAPPAN